LRYRAISLHASRNNMAFFQQIYDINRCKMYDMVLTASDIKL
jgi:hypothetical protein